MTMDGIEGARKIKRVNLLNPQRNSPRENCRIGVGMLWGL